MNFTEKFIKKVGYILSYFFFVRINSRNKLKYL